MPLTSHASVSCRSSFPAHAGSVSACSDLARARLRCGPVQSVGLHTAPRDTLSETFGISSDAQVCAGCRMPSAPDANR
eukprot:831982-Rhodomonas_salina.2